MGGTLNAVRSLYGDSARFGGGSGGVRSPGAKTDETRSLIVKHVCNKQ